MYYYKMFFDVLDSLGLSRNESKVYLALVELGGSKASSIIESTGLHRPNVYNSLKRLQEKGLVSTFIKDKKSWFTAADPKNLKKIISKKRLELEEVENNLEKAVPDIQKLMSQKKWENRVELFQGVDAFKTVIDDILESSIGEYHIIGYTGIARESLGDYHKRWDEIRVHKGIVRHALANKKVKNLMSQSPLTNVRYLPKEYSSPASTTIYKDKLVIHLMQQNIPVAIMITNPELAKTYRKYFDLLWSISKD